MTETNNKNKIGKIVLGVVVLVALIAVFEFVYTHFSKKPEVGTKMITIEVVNDVEETTEYKLNTDAEFLRQAMEEVEGLTFSGVESEFGLTIDTVNELRADYAQDGAYWAIFVNGEYGQCGVDTQPIANGDTFSIVYTNAE